MDIYVIPPVGSLELMNYGDRFFCLAQQYKKYPHYREFFKKKVAEGKWVTLDNGAGDHDTVDEDELLHIALDLKPSEVIPPDILFDGIKTIYNMERFIHRLRLFEYAASKFDSHASKPIQIFACPQGKDKEEWMFVYRYMVKHPEVSTIGMSKLAIPHIMYDKSFIIDKGIKEARIAVFNHLKTIGLITKPLHFLGLGDPTELEHYKDEPLVRSNDSCNSILSGINGFDWNTRDFTRIPTPKDYFDQTIKPEAYNVAKRNIKWLKELVKSA